MLTPLLTFPKSIEKLLGDLEARVSRAVERKAREAQMAKGAHSFRELYGDSAMSLMGGSEMLGGGDTPGSSKMGGTGGFTLARTTTIGNPPVLSKPKERVVREPVLAEIPSFSCPIPETTYEREDVLAEKKKREERRLTRARKHDGTVAASKSGTDLPTGSGPLHDALVEADIAASRTDVGAPASTIRCGRLLDVLAGDDDAQDDDDEDAAVSGGTVRSDAIGSGLPDSGEAQMSSRLGQSRGSAVGSSRTQGTVGRSTRMVATGRRKSAKSDKGDMDVRGRGTVRFGAASPLEDAPKRKGSRKGESSVRDDGGAGGEEAAEDDGSRSSTRRKPRAQEDPWSDADDSTEEEALSSDECGTTAEKDNGMSDLRRRTLVLQSQEDGEADEDEPNVCDVDDNGQYDYDLFEDYDEEEGDDEAPVIRLNLATVLREEMMLRKDEQKCQERLSAYASGNMDAVAYEEWRFEARMKEQRELEYRARENRLASMRSHQEALARKKECVRHKVKVASDVRTSLEKLRVDCARRNEVEREQALTRVTAVRHERSRVKEAVDMTVRQRRMMHADYERRIREEKAIVQEEREQEHLKTVERINAARAQKVKAKEALARARSEVFDPTTTAGSQLMSDMSMVEMYERLELKRVQQGGHITRKEACRTREEIGQATSHYRQDGKSGQMPSPPCCGTTPGWAPAAQAEGQNDGRRYECTA